jgi:hypothetical protein
MDQHWPIPGHSSVTVGATVKPLRCRNALGESGVWYWYCIADNL